MKNIQTEKPAGYRCFMFLLEHILKFIDILRAFISFIVLVSLNKSSKKDIVISFIYLDFTVLQNIDLLIQ